MTKKQGHSFSLNEGVWMKMLITGGTGSLGSRLVEHFHTKYEITVLSRGEHEQADMIKKYPDVKFVIGDVREPLTCETVVRGQDIVIHTAALKRIEICEMNPWEAVMTNLIGTRNMVHYAKRLGVPKFLLVSTDKACKPINTYGMTKALAERIVTDAGYNCVRYGNVNDSKGSVLPYWRKCKQEGLQITVTNPNMTRFIINFDEAIKLIEIALKNMNGDVYVPKLDAVKIRDVARLFSEEFKVIGERPCEKVNEELINEDEFRTRTEEFDSYYVIHKQNGEYRIDSYYPNGRYASNTTKILSVDEIKARLKAFLE